MTETNPYPDQLDFWSVPDHSSGTHAHAWKDGLALCESKLGPSRNQSLHWPAQPPLAMTCRPCLRVLMARVGRQCVRCLGKGKHCVRRFPSRRYKLCPDCKGIGYLRPLDLPTDGPPPPPAPNIRPPAP